MICFICLVGISFLSFRLFFVSNIQIIAVGKKTLKEIRQLYFRLREDVFGSGRLGMGYDTPKLEEILQHEFGTKMTMDDISYPRSVKTLYYA